MSPFRILAATLVLFTGLQALPAVAADVTTGSGDLIAATVIGTGLFVIAAPFAAAGGNLGATGKALVVDPGKAAFVRCLGCTGDGYGKQQ
jgi:hypothetical protein